MADDRQERIRQRAHEIWEREGRPHGAHERHWHQAAGEIESEESKGGKPARAASTKSAKVAAPEKVAKPKAAVKPAKAPAKAAASAKAVAAVTKAPAKAAKPAAKTAEAKPTAKKAAKPKAPAKAG